MSTRIEVSIDFKDETPEVFGGAEALTAALKEFHEDDKADIRIDEISHNGEKSVYLEMRSGRHVHALWLQDLLIVYIRDNFEIEDLYSDIWQISDESIGLTGEDLSKFKPSNYS